MSVKFGVVGTAYWAAEVHAPGIMATPGAELVGIHGRSHEKAAALAEKLGVRAFERYEDLLAETDAISIAVPPQAQPAFALQAATAGKHLLLEKPVATDLASASALADAVRERNLAAIVFFTRRFLPDIAALIESEAGRWTRAHIRIHASPMTTDSPYRNSLWRGEEGAALWDTGPHVLSVLLPMLGAVTSVRRLPAEPPYTRFATVHENGSEAEVSLTLHAPPDQRLLEYRFSGSSGDLVFPEPEDDRAAVFSRAAADLVAMVTNGRHTHPCDLRLGLETVRLLDMIERDV